MIKSTYKSLKKYWRIYLLIIVSIASIAIIFNPIIPGIDAGASNVDQGENREPSFAEKYTGIQFSIELGGGTRIRAPLDGVTAENITIGDMERASVERNVSDEFNGITATDVLIRIPDENDEDDTTTSLEVTSDGVDQEDLKQALDNNDVQYESVRQGVTQDTREQAVQTLQSRAEASGLSGGDVRQVELQNGEQLILLEVPNLERDEAIDLITRRGEVRIDAYYFDEEEDKYVNRTGVLTQNDIRDVGTPRKGDSRNPPNVPLNVEPQAAEDFQDDVVDTGIARVGGSSCQYEQAPQETQPCLLTVVDGDVVYSAGMAPSLAQSMRSGEWSTAPDFILQTGNFSEAQDLSVNLQSGSLPTTMDIENGEVSFIAPQQGQQFRIIALVIGIMSTLAVATSVSLRYGKIKIALPMMITALAEVLVMLSIAVLLSYPVDVAVIAGFIAVIGTGVDDLIIIADRVIGGSDPASSSRVFNARFKKALWIILSAAGTTILALGPLAVLQLRALQGFAIFTIIGVIAGVLLTRPAYGDMLRYLYTDK